MAMAWAKKPSAEAVKNITSRAAEKKDSLASTAKEEGEKDKSNPSFQNLVDIHKGFTAIAEAALPSVVNVATTQVVEIKSREGEFPRGFSGFPGLPEELLREFLDPDKPRRVQSLGSGFIIFSNEKFAFIVTNYHVIADAEKTSTSKKISIFLNDKTELEAALHAYDERTDIAVLKVKVDDLPLEKRKLPVLEWGDSRKVRVGEWVLAIGNPFGLGSTVTNGIISNISRDIAIPSPNNYVDSFIQHSAQINMGNSGGCLLDSSGKVIGINSAIFSPSGGNVGIGFAIPSDIAQKTVEQLMEYGRTKRGWLGVRIQNLTEDMAESLGLKTQGAIVGSVTPDGPAHKAGMQSGDVILAFDGKLINESNRLSRLVGETTIGKPCPIKIWRKGKELTLEVKVGEFEEAMEKGKIEGEEKPLSPGEEGAVEVLGIKVTSIPKDIKQKYNQNGPLKGIFILKIDTNSPAHDIGLMRGDIIVEANQKELNSPKEFKNNIEDARKNRRKNILLLVMRNNEPRYVSLKIDEDAEARAKEDDEKKPSQSTPTPFGKTPSSPMPNPPKKEVVPEHPANKPHLPAPAA